MALPPTPCCTILPWRAGSTVEVAARYLEPSMTLRRAVVFCLLFSLLLPAGLGFAAASRCHVPEAFDPFGAPTGGITAATHDELPCEHCAPAPAAGCARSGCCAPALGALADSSPVTTARSVVVSAAPIGSPPAGLPELPFRPPR